MAYSLFFFLKEEIVLKIIFQTLQLLFFVFENNLSNTFLTKKKKKKKKNRKQFSIFFFEFLENNFKSNLPNRNKAFFSKATEQPAFKLAFKRVSRRLHQTPHFSPSSPLQLAFSSMATSQAFPATHGSHAQSFREKRPPALPNAAPSLLYKPNQAPFLLTH